MFQALEEIYEKLMTLKSSKIDLDSLSSEELEKSKELINNIHKLGYAISQTIINEETIRKLYSKNVEGEYGR